MTSDINVLDVNLNPAYQILSDNYSMSSTILNAPLSCSDVAPAIVAYSICFVSSQISLMEVYIVLRVNCMNCIVEIVVFASTVTQKEVLFEK